MTASEGMFARASFTRACTSCSACCMSVLSLKYMDISAPPRMVRDLTRRKPATVLTCSSIGRVTVSNMVSGERSPACASTMILGKLSSG